MNIEAKKELVDRMEEGSTVLDEELLAVGYSHKQIAVLRRTAAEEVAYMAGKSDEELLDLGLNPKHIAALRANIAAAAGEAHKAGKA